MILLYGTPILKNFVRTAVQVQTTTVCCTLPVVHVPQGLLWHHLCVGDLVVPPRGASLLRVGCLRVSIDPVVLPPLLQTNCHAAGPHVLPLILLSVVVLRV